MAGIYFYLIILFIIIFVYFLFSYKLNRLIHNIGHTTTTTPNNNNNTYTQCDDMSPTIIDTNLYNEKYGMCKYFKGSSNDNECVLCLSKFTNNDSVIVLPCMHMFHNNVDCNMIIEWLRTKQTCPICNTSC